MYIKLCFDYHEKIIYIPDGYVNDIKKLSNDFSIGCINAKMQ